MLRCTVRYVTWYAVHSSITTPSSLHPPLQATLQMPPDHDVSSDTLCVLCVYQQRSLSTPEHPLDQGYNGGIRGGSIPCYPFNVIDGSGGIS